MEDKEVIERGEELATRANNLYNEKKYKEALSKYIQSLQYFQYALKHKPDEVHKLRIEEYNNRVNEIKKHLKSLQRTEEIKDKLTLDEGLELFIKVEKPSIELSKIPVANKIVITLRNALRDKSSPILLYGPPGTGKLDLGKASATELNNNFYFLDYSDAENTWGSKADNLVHLVFKMARANLPAVVFISGIEALFPKKDSSHDLKTELLKQIKDKDTGLLVIAVSNFPWRLNPKIEAFEKRIYCSPYDTEGRIKLLKMYLKEIFASVTDEEFKELAKLTDGYVYWDISTLLFDVKTEARKMCKDAKKFIKDIDGCYIPTNPSNPEGIECTLGCLPEPHKLKFPSLTMNDLVKCIKPAIFNRFKEHLMRYEKWDAKFGTPS